MARKINQEIKILASNASVFSALITPSSIQAWWEAKTAVVLAKAGGLMAITWGDNIDKPDYVSVARIDLIEKDKQLQLAYENYRSQSGGLPFEAHMIVIFSIEGTDYGCLLKVEQSGFPIDKIADEYFNGCQIGWQTCLTNIKEFVELGN